MLLSGYFRVELVQRTWGRGRRGWGRASAGKLGQRPGSALLPFRWWQELNQVIWLMSCSSNRGAKLPPLPSLGQE